jgi:hypothetical protein
MNLYDKRESTKLKQTLMKKNVKKVEAPRLSLADFKAKQNLNKTEIDKLVGGLAASCHPKTSTCVD